MSAAAGSTDPIWPHAVPAGGAVLAAAYAADMWRAAELGVTARRGRATVSFSSFHQDWLKADTKRWCRFRLSTGAAFTTVGAMALGLGRFSRFLRDEHSGIVASAGITRLVLEDFLAWMTASEWSVSTRAITLVMVRGFLDWGHRYDQLPGLAASAVLYAEEVTRYDEGLPQFIPEFVMAQLESDHSLAQLKNPTVRHLVILLIETGMRGGDAAELAYNPLIEDSVGWPCLRFANRKVRDEQLIPLSARAADTIRAQQAHVLERCPTGSPWLFPGISTNVDGAKPYAHSSLSGQLNDWQTRLDVRDEAGQPVRVHAHQFRHTLGTRLINAGVPQHVIQKLLGHASPRMTARYATIHDHTIRDAFAQFCQHRVNTAGEALAYDEDALTADAEWIKHNLARVRDSLPNGYCGRPPQQDCPHPNACLTCPDFQTTPEFLDVHRQQATTNRRLIARADANGQFRLADNLRQVQDSLDRIIPALEELDTEPTP